MSDSATLGEVVTEACIRVLLLITFYIFEHQVPPFVRIIQEEEAWKYKFPTKGFFPATTVYEIYFSNFISYIFHPYTLMVAGLAVILIVYAIDKKTSSARAATYTLTLALPLTGLITNIVKSAVGRPRPDFFNRCYGKDYLSYKNTLKPCYLPSDSHKILDGRRSFPSGHSAMSSCIMGFISLYLYRLLTPYSSPDLHKSWKYLLVMFPLLVASLVGISRTCEYKHHYEDVIAGCLLGLGIIYTVFHLYFPSSSTRSTSTH